MKYIAHSENADGVSQTMQEHSTGVGKFMRDFALSESFADLYEFCGLIHDIGKYSTDFQRHVSGESNKVRHSIYGAVFAMNQSLFDVAITVYGHHSGLRDRPKSLRKAQPGACTFQGRERSLPIPTWQRPVWRHQPCRQRLPASAA